MSVCLNERWANSQLLLQQQKSVFCDSQCVCFTCVCASSYHLCCGLCCLATQQAASNIMCSPGGKCSTAGGQCAHTSPQLPAFVAGAQQGGLRLTVELHGLSCGCGGTHTTTVCCCDLFRNICVALQGVRMYVCPTVLTILALVPGMQAQYSCSLLSCSLDKGNCLRTCEYHLEGTCLLFQPAVCVGQGFV